MPVFTTLYVIKKPQAKAFCGELKGYTPTNSTSNANNNQRVEVAPDGTIKINYNDTKNNNKKRGTPKRVTIQDLNDSEPKTEESFNNNNTNKNNINNDGERKKELKESDPAEELHDDTLKSTKDDVTSKDAENNSLGQNIDETEQNKLKKSAEQTTEKVSPRREVSSSPRVTEPDDKHVTSENDEDGQDPENEDEVHETIVLSSSSSQIRTKKTSRRVDEINEEIAEHQTTIQLLEKEADTADNKLKVAELKVFVTKLKMKRVEIEVTILWKNVFVDLTVGFFQQERMASNALSFEQMREMQRQNKFKRQAKMEEISKSSEYRSVKTGLTEKHNEVRAFNRPTIPYTY